MTPDRTAERSIAERYVAGESMNALSAEFGLDVAKIRQALHVAGITIRPSRLLPLPLEHIATRCQDGCTTQAIADELGVSENAIRRRLRALGLHPVRRWERLPSAEIAQLYRDDVPVSQLARRFRTSTHTIRRLLAEQGIQIATPRPIPPKTVRRAIRLYQSGLSIRAVATQLELGRSRVHSLLNAHGVIRSKADTAAGPR